MLVMGKSRALVVTVCLLVVGSLLMPQATADHAIDVVDKYAGRSRTYTAYTNDTGTIFEIKFQTLVPGEKRRIRARVKVQVPSTTSDPMIVARHAIRCGPVGSRNYEQLYGVRNVLRGQTYVQRPRYTFTAGLPGQYRCWLWLGSGRPRPSGTRTASNVFRLGWGSYLHATKRIHIASGQDFTPDDPSHLLKPGQASDENVLTWTAPLLTNTFSASGDAYITTCTSGSGSTDPITRKQLCKGHTKLYGSKVNTRLIVGQLRADGSGYCALNYYPSKRGRPTYITRDIHHVVVFNSGAVPVRTGNGCGRAFRVKVMIKAVTGGTVMVHRQGTITAAIPPVR